MNIIELSNELFDQIEEKQNSVLVLSKNEYYLNKIESCDYKDFLFHNFGSNATTYNNNLLSVFPFLWEKINADDLHSFLISFTKKQSYQGIINVFSFCSKYFEIDILNYYLSLDLEFNDYQKIFENSNDGILPLLYLYTHEKEALTEDLIEEFSLLGKQLRSKKFNKMPSIEEYRLKGKDTEGTFLLKSKGEGSFLSKLFSSFKLSRK